ncbi:hypothetical protein FACS1894201_03990 [Bacteroidia bacterium]|nr:hypothetical protein FACS1894201_03990 [Bacteroidia bacterium]
MAQAQANEPEMVVVAGGTTVLNGTTVTMDNFHISKYEITQKQWYDVMGSWAPADAPSPQYGVGDDYPMYNVSYDDILTYLEKLNQLTGKDYRLPTEAEWEYAAKGGQSTNNYTYSGSNTIGEVAWYSANAGNKTHAVGSKTANELDLYDMSGNVREWCSDRYGSQYPSDVINPVGASFQGSYFVIRGGGWNGDTANCAVTNRRNNSPSYRYPYVGFRVVCCADNNVIQPVACGIDMITVESGNTTLNGTAVFISTFQIGKYEVTQKLWYCAMGSWPSTAPSGTYGMGDDYPMYNVSWEDIVGTSSGGSLGYTEKDVTYYTNGFCYKLSVLANGGTLGSLHYRLPTEAEWEYAAKGGQSTHNYTYSGSNTVDEVAWSSENSGGTTHTIGTKTANELGIYDMTGNVWEWCSDWHGSTYPSGTSNPTGATTGSDRVVRSGSWNNVASSCTVSYRNYYSLASRYNFDLGFRVVIDP